MLLDAALGAWLMHSQGRAVWRRFREDLAAGRPPTRHVLDGALVIAGGAFLITPGFVTDLLGAFLLVPPTRAIARRMVVRRIVGRLPLAAASAAGGAGSAWAARRRAAPGGGQPADAYDVDGTAVEVPRDELDGRDPQR